MSTETILFFTYLGTLLLAGLYGLLVWSNIAVQYRPMLIFTWAIFVLQIIESFFQLDEQVKSMIRHFEPVIELALVAWQAKRWRMFDRRPIFFWVMAILVILSWIGEELLMTGSQAGISWVSVACSFLITLVAIELLNRTMISSLGPIFRNPVFLFSVALVFYYTFSGLLEVFMLIGQYSGKGMLSKAFYFYVILGIFTNIIYLRSFLCIPTKTNYSIS